MRRRIRKRFLHCAATLLATCAAAANEIDFAHEIVPIIKARCGRCHTDGTYKGGVSLDSRESLLESEIVIVGKSAQSELLRRVTATDREERMPPSGRPLSEEEIVLLKRWIDGGLSWQEGFSFKKRAESRPLKLQPPKVPSDPGSNANPVDRVLAAYFEDHGTGLPDLVDDVTFARRVYLDLIGLLPTPVELEEFLNDKGDDKRERLVDGLLHRTVDYADHWLSFWSDLLRNDYQGTGYIDGGRKPITKWLYRSLLENKPYDQFVRELIHPSAESEGFIRGIKWRGRVNASQSPELQFAQNVSQVLLGINMKCASCHDSFIDDWKLVDAWGLAAIASERPLEIHRCDKPTGQRAEPKFVFSELGAMDASLSRDGRLARLAELLTHRDNGRFARTVVNRLWERLLGRGIVTPVDVMRNPAWSADLLEYLANYLVDERYDLKRVLRLIATSRAYQAQSVDPPPPGEEGRYVFRGPLARRMTAEQFVDAVWGITGTAPAKPAADFGDRQGAPIRAGLVTADLLMRSLGRPNREQVVTVRPGELTTLQALDLTNGTIMTETLQRGARHWLSRSRDLSVRELVDTLFLHALCRKPTTSEAETLVQAAGTPPTENSLAEVLWLVFMLPEFQVNR